jgi:hypothetical protein
MAIVSRNNIKNWFKTNLHPTQLQFWDWIDSYWHKSDTIPLNKIGGLQDLLEEKTDAEIFEHHLDAANQHSGQFDLKVDKVVGKTLSSNDFTDELLEKLNKIVEYNVVIVDASRSYLPSDNGAVLLVNADVTLTLQQSLPDGSELPLKFRCDVYMYGDYTLTNATVGDLVTFPKELSLLKIGKMQHVMRNTHNTNEFLILGGNI